MKLKFQALFSDYLSEEIIYNCISIFFYDWCT